ncbi:JmjC domain, hydroxylase [Seminavis robusta]|uniref:JmjC domain, hydroxylase n=1 Tax=Seminavis robusta TaxID=568900 RepID=A0A9N8EF22_9STRA|nr:JmjC domain, hydroxylase [Seminavis robusta]|eukprot:Sro999_g229630.1 JmjC domain, hydroxylase (933) ;mRNA; r:11482-14412
MNQYYCLLLLLLSSLLGIVQGQTQTSPAQQQEEDVIKVVELGVSNFQDVLQSQEWTCVLLYDPWDERSTYEHTLILEGIYDKFVHRYKHQNDVTFARLNGRKHSLLREEYLGFRGGGELGPDDGSHNPFARDYHDSLEGNANAILAMTNETFLDFSLGTPYWPHSLLLLAPSYNVYGQVDLNLVTGAIPLRIAILDRWLVVATQDDWRFMPPLITTKANIELEMNHEALHHSDNSFPFDKYRQEQQQQAALQKTTQAQNTSTTTSPTQPDQTPQSIDQTQQQQQQQQQSSVPTRREQLRLLLENHAKDDGKISNNYYFTYKKAATIKIKNSDHYLDTLGAVIDEYLAWAEGYERTWSPARRAREDEQTNFGVYFSQMNDEIHQLIEELFHDDETTTNDPRLAERMRINPEIAAKMEVPVLLKSYLREMVFGSGRFPSTLKQQFVDHLQSSLGETAADRRRNRYDANITLPLVDALRDYITVRAMVEAEPHRSSILLAELTTGWYNILRDFHRHLSKYYLSYLKKHPRDSNKIPYRTMDVLDMKDPEDYHLLGDYNAFHDKYTRTGTPVVLSHVQMIVTDDLPDFKNVTIDYIVQECRSMDVTDSVQVSRKVGEKAAATGWGGLGRFVLPNSLLNSERRKPRNMNGQHYFEEDFFGQDQPRLDVEAEDFVRKSKTDKPDNSKHNKKDRFDRSLTMEQFAILAEEVDTLYLHDKTLPGYCDRLLYDETPYSKKQKFQIPMVIGGYDMAQRLSQSFYANSWPSLFMGKKGSNSKLHIDSGATAFFMYLISGRKRWIVYNRSERVHAYERIDDFTTYPDVLATGKDPEFDEFLSDRFPLLHRAEEAYEFIQEPGQLVYIPPSCPHAVENLDDTVGLAMNLVPRDGIANHLHEQIQSTGFSTVDLVMTYLMFEDNADKPVDTKDPLYTTWAEYKAQN